MHLVFCIKSSKTHGEFRVRKMANQSARQSEKLRRGSWHEEEDKQLTTFVTWMGEKKWDLIAKDSGLERSGKSCRFRWLNYLRPNLKRGCISSEEEGIILQLHRKWGNKWSRIARWLPGRTDNEIKNYWRSHLRKKIPIQPEEYFQCKPKVGKQEPPFKKCAIIGPRYGHEDKDVPKSNSHNLIGFSNFEVTESPYEIPLSNWIAQLTNDDNREVNCHIECESLGFCYCYPNMNFTENNQRDYLWDSLFSSLWDMAA